MAVYLAGASGLIGGAVIEHFLGQGWSMTGPNALSSVTYVLPARVLEAEVRESETPLDY
jgi:nucleoside-diphosphate-sugar epimerase